MLLSTRRILFTAEARRARRCVIHRNGRGEIVQPLRAAASRGRVVEAARRVCQVRELDPDTHMERRPLRTVEALYARGLRYPRRPL